MPTVLLSAAPDAPRPAPAGVAVVPHALGAVAPVDFAAVAVAVVVAEPVAAAAAQTRRWRAELADEYVPILWLVTRPDAAVVGLDAGADACLVLPVEPAVLAAQVNAMARARAAAGRVFARAAEARLLGDQLRQAFARHDADRDLLRRVHGAALPAELPPGVAVARRSRGRAGTAFHDARRVGGRVAFVAGEVPGFGGAAGHALGLLALRAALPPDADPDPVAVLDRVNAALLALRLDDPPLVALLAGVLDGETVTVARAGLHPPVWLPAGGGAEAWPTVGPYLGTSEATFVAASRPVGAGDRLLVAAGAAGADVAAVARRHAADLAPAEAVATDLAAAAAAGEDVLVMTVGRAPPP